MPVIFALLVSLLPYERPVMNLDNYVDRSNLFDDGPDCVQRANYGGLSEVLCDLAPALKRAVAECEAMTKHPNGVAYALDANVGCNIVVPQGVFYWGSTVELCHNGTLKFGEAMIRSEPGVTQLRTLRYGECLTEGRPQPTSGWTIDGGQLRVYGVTTVAAPAFAIDVQHTTRIVGTHIHGFTQAIHIYANGATSQPLEDRALANLTRIENVMIESSHHAGIWFDGPDANAGTVIATSITGSCQQHAALEATLGPCADAYDGSFLGNYWMGVHTSNLAGKPGFILGDSASSHAVAIAPYTEGVGVVNTCQGQANVVGGIGGFTGPCAVYQGKLMNGLELVGGGGKAKIRMGDLSPIVGSAFTIYPVAQVAGAPFQYPLSLNYSTSGSGATASAKYTLNVSGVAAGNVADIGANTNALNGLGGMVLRPGTSANVYLNNSGYITQRQVP